MKRLLLPLLTAIALPTAVNAESYWLILKQHRGDGIAFEKIEMESMEQCKEQGKVFIDNAKKGFNRYFCLKGK